MFETLDVIPYYPDTCFLQWQLKNHYSAGTYEFFVYYSGNPNSAVEDLTPISTAPVINQYSCFVPFELLEKSEFVYFTVRLRLNGKDYYSSAQGLLPQIEKRYYLVARELIRKKDLYRRKVVGVACTVYKQKRFGARCTACTDRHTGHQKDSVCLQCFGTRYVGGYEPGFNGHVEITDALHEKLTSEIGMLENKICIGKLTLPILGKGDIILENARRRLWYVTKSERELIRNFPVDQHLDIRQLSPKDIEYKFLEQ
jgi:hypothetical protein